MVAVVTGGVFLSGRLPVGESNGLGGIVADLVNDPEHVHVLVVLADVIKVTRVVESGDTVPTLRVRRVEAIGDTDDRRTLERLLMREYERRTGQPTLPLELEDDVRSAFADLDAPPPDDDPPPDPPAPKRRRRS